jgi:hypothetical protein
VCPEVGTILTVRNYATKCQYKHGNMDPVCVFFVGTPGEPPRLPFYICVIVSVIIMFMLLIIERIIKKSNDYIAFYMVNAALM